MNETFKKHKLSEAELLWLKEIYTNDKFDVKLARVKLYDKLPKSFNPKNIDNRFLIEGKSLTFLGVWYIDPDSDILKNVDKVIIAIKNMILNNPGLETVTAELIAKDIGIDQRIIEAALYNMRYLDSFFTNAVETTAKSGITQITLSGDDGYNAFLRYENLDGLLERSYGRPESTVSSYIVPFQSGYQLYPGSIYGVPPETKKYEIKSNTAFVIMAINPDKPELEDVYTAIKEVCSSFSINAYRADEIEHQDKITDRILAEIKSCEFLIADLTDERPNVYYEVGYAHANDKRPILYRKAGTKLHFDLSVHNVPEYKNVTELKRLLEKRLEAILGRSLA